MMMKSPQWKQSWPRTRRARQPPFRAIFGSCPPVSGHARFCETKIEQETSEFSTAPTDAASEIFRAEDADAAGLEMDMPVDPSPVFVPWPAE